MAKKPKIPTKEEALSRARAYLAANNAELRTAQSFICGLSGDGHEPHNEERARSRLPGRIDFVNEALGLGEANSDVAGCSPSHDGPQPHDRETANAQLPTRSAALLRSLEKSGTEPS